MPRNKQWDPTKLYVRNAPCPHCLFGPNALVGHIIRQGIVASVRLAGTHFICHEGTLEGHNICCATFRKLYPGQLEFRLSEFLGNEVLVTTKGTYTAEEIRRRLRL